MGCGASSAVPTSSAAPREHAAPEPVRQQAQAVRPASPAKEGSLGSQAPPPSQPQPEAPQKTQPASTHAASPAAPAEPPPDMPEVLVSDSHAAAQDQSLHKHEVTSSGISLTFLINFLDEVPAGWSTLDVVLKFVVPKTKDPQPGLSHCKYVDVLPEADIGPPTKFISHRWAARFHDTVNLVLKYFNIDLSKGKEQALQAAASLDDRVWLDIFAINQHPGAEQKDDLANLCNVVHRSHDTLLCLDAEGEVLKRIWCLYEIWQTIQGDGSSNAPQGSGKGSKLVVLCDQVDSTAMSSIFETLNASHASATVEADRKKILTDIAASMGVDALNISIREALVSSTVAEVERAKAANMTAADMAGVLIKCIRMLKSFGKYSDANNLLKAEFPALESALGKDDLQVGYILFEHGQVYRKLGMGDDVPTLETAILIFEKELGKDHFDTASARMHLGIGHLACHQIQKALDLMKPAVDRIEEIVGPEDKAVVKALFELAEAHRIAGNQEEQTRLLLRSIEVSKAAYGPNHPETANQYMSYGEMLRVSNRDDEAAKYLELARDIFVASLGSGHLMAGHVENRLSSLHINTQLWSKVESHGLTCLEIYKAWYPPEHQFLGHIRAKLARGYVGAGKWKEAKAYAEESLVTLRRYSQDPFLPFCEWSLNQADTHLA